MNRTPQAQIAAIDHEIAALTARKAALQTQVDAPWPKRVTLYAHCLKKGKPLGLTGEVLRLFMHFVPLEVEVGEDGMVTVLACDGTLLQR